MVHSVRVENNSVLRIEPRVNHRASTAACQPPYGCQPVDRLTESSSHRTASSSSQSSETLYLGARDKSRPAPIAAGFHRMERRDAGRTRIESERFAVASSLLASVWQLVAGFVSASASIREPQILTAHRESAPSPALGVFLCRAASLRRRLVADSTSVWR